MNVNKLAIAIVVGIIGSGSFASGFRCEGEGYRVKLFNHVSGATRTPAKLVISTDEDGTLLTRSADEITKHNRANTVQYVVNGNSKLGADKAILQISFKEGREVLEAGEVADGQLILTEDGEKLVVALQCERYLKND